MKPTILLAFAALIFMAAPHGALGCRQRDDDKSKVVEAASPDGGQTVRVSGHVRLNPSPATLPANARLVLRLSDISLADAPSKQLAEKTMSSVAATFGPQGIPFSIEANIPTGTPFIPNAVAVSASLQADGLSYITDTAYFVDLSPNTFDYKDMSITIIKYP